MRKDNPFVVLRLIVKELKLAVTQNSILEELQKHPNPYSLVAFSDVLDHWFVANSAYAVNVNEMLSSSIPLPFIACLKDGEFALINNIDQQTVVISNDRWNNHRLDLSEFKKYYRGTILAFSKDSSSGETDYVDKRRKEISKGLRLPFLVSTSALIFLIASVSHLIPVFNLSASAVFLLLIKSAGLAISLLLLVQSLDANSAIIKKICGTDDTKSCNAILSSKAAKLTKDISWSEIGFFYFAGTWLALICNGNNQPVIKLLEIFNLFCLPYTVYSIYYQWRIAKQWCVFCCLVQVLLWLEFICFAPQLTNTITLTGLHQGANKIIIALLVPIMLWVFLKPLLIDSKYLATLKPELYRFKYNQEFFKNIIEKELRYDLLNDDDTVVIGNVEAEHTITIVSNPFCHACAEAHKIIDELIDIRDDVKVQFVFLTRIYAIELDKKILTHFMELKSHYDDAGVKKALKSWYNQDEKNYERWQQVFPVNSFSNFSETIPKNKEWCKAAKITGTPTVFINGRKLPNPYKPEDIKYLI